MEGTNHSVLGRCDAQEANYHWHCYLTVVKITFRVDGLFVFLLLFVLSFFILVGSRVQLVVVRFSP